MKVPTSVAVVLTMITLGACGEEEHGEHEFESRAECEEHYREEGHSDEEIAELCADVEDEAHDDV